MPLLDVSELGTCPSSPRAGMNHRFIQRKVKGADSEYVEVCQFCGIELSVLVARQA